jgi:hypothetical protein
VWQALRLILPAVWLGLIIAIDLIEAPLKFQAPGITIPLGLGIGRLVFLAMNFTELVIALVLVIALWRGRADRRSWWLAISVVAVFAVKFTIIRPLLARHTNEVLAGGEGGSLTHYFYIGADAVLFVLLVWFLVTQARRLVGVREERVVGSR